MKLQGTVSTTHAAATGSNISIKTSVKRTYKIRDAATGETKEYHSLDEVPAPYRAKMNHALEQQGHVVRSQAISFTGPDGITHTFRSLDEVPGDIRALIERAGKSSG